MRRNNDGRRPSSRRSFLRATGAATGLAALAGCLGAGGGGGYPSQPIRFIVPYSEGGGSDAYVRTVAPILADELGGEVEVENVPGGAGLRGLGELARADPDGYTLAIYNPPVNVIGALVQEPSFDIPEFTHLGIMGSTGSVLVSNPDVESDLGTVVEKFRDGTYENIGGVSRGTIHHALALVFASVWNMPNEYVAYDGSSPVIQAAASGEIPVGLPSATAARSAVDAGEVNVLAALHSEGNPVFPDAPTVTDAGFSNVDYLARFYRGVVAPPGVADDRRSTLVDALEAAVKSEEFQQWGEETGNGTAYGGPDELLTITENGFEQLPEQIDIAELKGS